MTISSTPTSTSSSTPSSPTRASLATRARTPGWRDPRIVVGVVIVAASVLLGARLMASADDTVGVWAVERDLPEGASLGTAQLERREVRFREPADADRYVAATSDLPEDARLGRPMGAGELLPRSALASGSEPKLIEVPVSVAVNDVPATVRPGSVVDVWVSAKTAATGEAVTSALRVFDDVVVVSVPRSAGSLAPESTRQVIIGVEPDQADVLAKALGSTATGHVVITRQR